MDMKEQVYMLAIEKYKGIKDAAQSLHISPACTEYFLSNLEERSGVHFLTGSGNSLYLPRREKFIWNMQEK